MIPAVRHFGNLSYSAKRKSKLFEMVMENKLITTGVYGIVRNPVYSAVLLACTGAVCMAGNLFLFPVPLICWIYMTVFLKLTEEKWLADRYGQDYLEYCKRTSRCIPWFPDVVFVCVKSYSLDSVLPILENITDSHTVVIPILNVYRTGAKLQARL